MDNEKILLEALNKLGNFINVSQEFNEDQLEAIYGAMGLVKNLTIPNVRQRSEQLKAFVAEFIEAWEDGSGGDSDLCRKAKSLL